MRSTKSFELRLNFPNGMKVLRKFWPKISGIFLFWNLIPKLYNFWNSENNSKISYQKYRSILTFFTSKSTFLPQTATKSWINFWDFWLFLVSNTLERLFWYAFLEIPNFNQNFWTLSIFFYYFWNFGFYLWLFLVAFLVSIFGKILAKV